VCPYNALIGGDNRGAGEEEGAGGAGGNGSVPVRRVNKEKRRSVRSERHALPRVSASLPHARPCESHTVCAKVPPTFPQRRVKRVILTGDYAEQEMCKLKGYPSLPGCLLIPEAEELM